jgi:hypothetical protein
VKQTCPNASTRKAGKHGFYCSVSFKAARRTGFPGYKATRKDALETALGFLGQGMKNVSIVDEQGRVLTTHEFSLDDD